MPLICDAASNLRLMRVATSLSGDYSVLLEMADKALCWPVVV